MYKNVKKKIDRGVAFRTCISVYNTVGHFLPLAHDGTVLEDGDMVKIDMGFHIDELIALVAHTQFLQEGPITGRKAHVEKQREILEAKAWKDLSVNKLDC